MKTGLFLKVPGPPIPAVTKVKRSDHAYVVPVFVYSSACGWSSY